MKVIQIPFCYYPDPVGGTEVYVAALARHLQARGCQVRVAAPGVAVTSYEHDGLPVDRYPVGPLSSSRSVYGEGDEVAARAFAELLDREQPDLVHFHALTRGVSLKLVTASRRRRIPVVFTYHTPTVTCQRGTMMRWGSEPCDGLMQTAACSECALHRFGVTKPIARLIGLLPPGLGGWFGRCGINGDMGTALRMTEMVAYRQEMVRQLFDEVDHIVAVCDWVRQVLLRNGVPDQKISLSRQGLAHEMERPEDPPRPEPMDVRTELRLCFLGRLDPTKGLDVLVKAFRAVPEVKARLDIFGVAQDEGGGCYVERLKQTASADKRLRFFHPVASSEVAGLLRTYDALMAPSQWLETGPLVVLEAFAAGVPVIGSRRGGIAELVTDGIDGLLVEAGSAKAWAEVIRRMSSERELLVRLRSGIRPPKTMATVADEMLPIYRKLSPRAGNLPVHPANYFN